MSRIRDWWLYEKTHHAQDWLGYFEVISGVLESIDMATVNLVGGWLGPKYGPWFSKAIQIYLGVRIAYVGYRHRQGKA